MSDLRLLEPMSNYNKDIINGELRALHAIIKDLESRLAEAKAEIATLKKYAKLNAEEHKSILQGLSAKLESQRERIVYLEGATNHAEGTPLSKALAEVEALRAKLSMLKSNNQLAEELCEVAARLPDDDTLYNENTILKAKLQKCVDYLLAHEFGGGDVIGYCEVCGGVNPSLGEKGFVFTAPNRIDHKPDCWLAALLKEVKG